MSIPTTILSLKSTHTNNIINTVYTQLESEIVSAANQMIYEICSEHAQKCMKDVYRTTVNVKLVDNPYSFTQILRVVYPLVVEKFTSLFNELFEDFRFELDMSETCDDNGQTIHIIASVCLD